MNMLNLPRVVADLVAVQNAFDSVAYSNCFSGTAIVQDEGETHQGPREIERWIAEANGKYKATMRPVNFENQGDESVLKAEVSGDFKGSPIVLTYHLEIADERIRFLKITG